MVSHSVSCDEAQNHGDGSLPGGVRLIRRVVDEIACETADRTGAITGEATRPLEDLDAYRVCLEAVVEGEEPTSTAAHLPGSARFLADLFRARLLAGGETASAATTLEVLRAIEALQHASRSGRVRDPDPELQAWLRRPDAFGLLVEVAHDLRSPLTSILFLSEAIRAGQSGDLNDLQRSQLGLIYSAALGLVAVTSNVVELARDERSLVADADARAFSVAEVLQNVAQMVRPMAEEKGVELRVVAPEYERSQGHPAALSRVLLNLATNGLKFTENGYVEIGVQRLSHRALRFHVQDSGRGIAPPQLEQLFQPFRKRQRKEGYFFSGSGLGLSICQRLLNAMGSELEVETEMDRGTRFHFTLDASRFG